MRKIIPLIALFVWTVLPLAARAADGMEGMEGMDMSMHNHSMPAATATAPASTGPAPTITVAPRTEEGKRMIGATVVLNGKPLAGAKVTFFVQRTFGALDIGHDETFEDGVAMVKFPDNLPGGTEGKLHVIAKVAGAANYAASSGETIVPSDVVVVPETDPFPRAIWAPHAPIPLILTLTIALGGVWVTYMFVLLQLRALRKAGNS